MVLAACCRGRLIPVSIQQTRAFPAPPGNFDKIWTDQPAVDSPCGTPTQASLGKFEGFTYVAPCFLAGHGGAAFSAAAAAAAAAAVGAAVAAPVAAAPAAAAH